MLEPENKRNRWFSVIIAIEIILVIILITTLSLYFNNRKKIVATNNIADSSYPSDIISSDVEKNEYFIDKVQEKETEIQKKFDSNLVEFAQERWQKIFQEYNNVNSAYLEQNIKYLSQNMEKTKDGSTLFKIKYKINQGGSEIEKEDYFYLMLSDIKKNELDLDNLEPDVFLTEEDIRQNINRENFVRIGKINK